MHPPSSQQRHRKSHDFPQKQPQIIIETPLLLFFGAVHSGFHFSDRVLNTRTWCASSDFSMEHPLLQITPSNSYAVQLSRSLAHFRRLAARSGINFGRRFTSHFVIPFFRKCRPIVACDTSGARSSHSCSPVCFRLCLIICRIAHRSHLVSSLGFLDLGRLDMTAYCSPLKEGFNGQPRAACKRLTMEILRRNQKSAIAIPFSTRGNSRRVFLPIGGVVFITTILRGFRPDLFTKTFAYLPTPTGVLHSDLGR